MASQAAHGKKALDEKNYELAIKEYTAAIKEAPTSPEYFIQRSTAHQRNKQYDKALADAEQGIVNAHKRAKKEAIIQGQFRRGLALYNLGRYGDAAFCLDEVKRQNKDHKEAELWINKTKLELKKLPEDDKRRQCTITATPDPSNTSSDPITSHSNTTSTNGRTSESASSAPPAPLVAPPQQTPADKIRYEWYQNTENIYFTLLAKGVPKDKAQIEITERSLSVSFPLTNGSSYDLTLDPLFAPVMPNKCITRIMPSKTEIILIKATPGQKWSALESSEPVAVKAGSGADEKDDGAKNAVFGEATQAGPAYPTSSKRGPKDWDKVANDLRKDDVRPDGKTSIEDDDDYEGGDEANHFFKKLFKGASPEMQRAMMKSYTESNGTSLSTNWEEVSKGKVETLPPDGMEAKPWNQ